ncbi:MAG TPA: RraA family protein [Candidatus Dormibacteraeota bacterium]
MGDRSSGGEVLDALRRYDSPTLANAIETFDVRPRDEGFASMEIRCLFPELGVMVGYAATATIRARGRGDGDSDHSPLWALVRSQPGPRVVVVQDHDDPPGHGALWGEVQSSIYKALGCVGTVTDGCVRDLKEVREMGFHFFARGPGVSHAYVRLESIGEPVRVGGLTVRPGDLVHADQHGVLLIPHEIAAELPAAADRIIEREQEFIRWVRSAEFDPDRLAEMRRVRH